MEPVAFLIIFINILFELLAFAIIARVLLSWINRGSPGPITRVLAQTTEPVLAIARRITPRLGMLDISPIIALIGIDLVKYVLTIILERI